jgi:hypothetical protein
MAALAAMTVAAALLIIVSGTAVAVSGTAVAEESGLNACGCRQTAQGLCFCERKAKCGCPGECEPKGCEERRAKEMEREIQAETKKAEEASRKQDRANSEDSSGAVTDETPKATPTRGTKKVAAPIAAASVPRMTPAQKRELARLLGLYLAEHPDDASKSVEQIRNDVIPSGTTRTK